MPCRGAESDFQLAAIERLERLGYEHVVGLELERPHGLSHHGAPGSGAARCQGAAGRM